MSETTSCFFCEAEISKTAKKCHHCSEWLARDCTGCGIPLWNARAARGLCMDCEKRTQAVATGRAQHLMVRPHKSRGLAAGMAVLLGGFGAHKFYLGRVGWGVAYLMFSWTLIPSFAGVVEGVKYAMTPEERFQAKYSGAPPIGPTRTGAFVDREIF